MDTLFECLRHHSYLTATGVKTEAKPNVNTSTTSGAIKPDVIAAPANPGGNNGGGRRLTSQNSGSGKEDTKKSKPEVGVMYMYS